MTGARVTAIVPARNEAARIRATVTALQGIVDEVLVVDDASDDDTGAIAREAGARVVRQPRRSGKGAALRRGLAGCDAPVVVFVDGDLGETAAVAGPLLEPVRAGTADMTIAAPGADRPSGFGLVESFARWAIRRLARTQMRRPLSGQRAIRREIVDRFPPADRFGVEVGLTIDAVRAGYRVIEVPYEITHAKTGRDARGFLHRARQGLDVALVAAARASRGPRRGRTGTG